MIVTNSLTGGGAERSMNLVANELTKRGWPIALVPINSGLPDLIIPICEVFPLGRTWPGRLFDTILAIINFNKTVNIWNPDIIVLNCDLPELFGALIFSRRNLIVVEHINRPWITRRLLGRVVRKILRGRNVIWVAVSSHLTIWPGNIAPQEILLNSISPSPAPVTNRLITHNFPEIERLVFIGRLAPQKRPDWLLEIARQTRLPVEFIGDGKLREFLEKSANSMKQPVTFHGQLRHPWSFIREGDLVVIPSEYEGDGLVAIECLRQELPLLLADIPDFRRFEFPEENYCLDVDEFVNRIEDYKLRLGELLVPQNIREKILKSRDITAVGSTWEKFLNSI